MKTRGLLLTKVTLYCGSQYYNKLFFNVILIRNIRIYYSILIGHICDSKFYGVKP
jgi:hypothetical protein